MPNNAIDAGRRLRILDDNSDGLDAFDTELKDFDVEGDPVVSAVSDAAEVSMVIPIPEPPHRMIEPPLQVIETRSFEPLVRAVPVSDIGAPQSISLWWMVAAGLVVLTLGVYGLRVSSEVPAPDFVAAAPAAASYPPASSYPAPPIYAPAATSPTPRVESTAQSATQSTRELAGVTPAAPVRAQGVSRGEPLTRTDARPTPTSRADTLAIDRRVVTPPPVSRTAPSRPSVPPPSRPAPFASLTPTRPAESPSAAPASANATPAATTAAPSPSSAVSPAAGPAPVVPSPEPVRAEPPAAAPPPPTPAAAAASAPAVITPPADRVAIERVLQAYRDSYTKLDATSAAEIWPRVDTRALSRAFSTLVQQDVTFDRCDMSILSTRATARCVGNIRYVRRVGDQVERVRRLSWRFALERVGDRWQIAQVTAD